MVIILNKEDIKRILEVERRAFIPSIRATEEIILKRFEKEHIYLGIQSESNLVGTLALRFAYFNPDFKDFCSRNPTFFEYVERNNENNPNSVFVYSIGIIPEHRNGLNSRKLLQFAHDIAVKTKMTYLVGDARVPSYNGSNKNQEFEQYGKNEELHRAINNYFITGELPKRELIKKDPVAGFYLRIFPKAKILGISDENFWKADEPCGGHMIIEYIKLK